MSALQVVIPLAGLGTRLRPHTFVRPKPLLSVAGKPILEHIVEKLAGLEIVDVTFIVGHLGDQVERWAATNCPYPSRFVEQRELRGQAHALSLVREHVHHPVLIVFGDTIFDANLGQLETLQEDGLLFVRQVEDPRRFGVAVVRNGIVERLVEKPRLPVSDLAVVGIYYIRDPGALFRAIDVVIARDLQIGGEYYLADALQAMIDAGARFRVGETPVWADCGTVDAVLATNAFLLARANGDPGGVVIDSTIVPPVYIHPSARIERSIVGPNVAIGPDVAITRSILDDAIINAGAEIEECRLTHSIIGDRARVHGYNGRLSLSDHSEATGT